MVFKRDHPLRHHKNAAVFISAEKSWTFAGRSHGFFRLRPIVFAPSSSGTRHISDSTIYINTLPLFVQPLRRRSGNGLRTTELHIGNGEDECDFFIKRGFFANQTSSASLCLVRGLRFLERYVVLDRLRFLDIRICMKSLRSWRDVVGMRSNLRSKLEKVSLLSIIHTQQQTCHVRQIGHDNRQAYYLDVFFNM